MQLTHIDNEGMPEEPTFDFSPSDGPSQSPAAVPPGRNVQVVEVAVFLFLIVPSLAFSFLAGSDNDIHFVTSAISSILNDLALLSLVLYFLWRNGEPVRQIGWEWSRMRADIGLGILLFVPVFFGANALANFLHSAGLSAPSKTPSFLSVSGTAQIVLGFAIVSVVAVVEETIFRGYLMLRFSAVTGRTAAAVILSSLVFALGHGYEGMAGAISVFTLGVVFALVYLWRRSIVAPIVIHFLTDFTSIVLPALIHH